MAVILAPGVRAVVPHDPGAFTQGLEIRSGYLWETTGLYGSSSFRRTSMETGEVLDVMHFPDSIFAEGFTFLDDSTVCVLTWKEGTAFKLNPWTMQITDELPLDGEGWGICLAGGHLYQSSGSATLNIRDPETFAVLGTLEVTLNGQPQSFLNELEYAYGHILANQWQTSRILFIDPGTGQVDRVINLREATPAVSGVMNGLAITEEGTLFCSGKNWPLTLILDGIE